MISLKLLNKQQLFNFIHSDEYRQMPVLPISYHRAMSHINNPRATDEDVLLIIAYEDNKMLGYLGVLPDNITVEKQTLFHAGWLSCIWVSPLARGKGIAKKMVSTAYDSYQQHILITNFTSEAAALYEKLGIFLNLPSMEGVRYYRRMCLSKVLPARYPKMQKMQRVLNIADDVFNTGWQPFVTKQIDKFLVKDADLKHIPYERYFQQCSFNRSFPEFNWIISYPWIKQVTTISDEALRYHFSSEDLQFESRMISVFNDSQQIGYLFYSLRNGHLKIPYIFCKPENYQNMARFIESLIYHTNADYITLFEAPDIKKQLRFTRLYSKKMKRHFKITKTLLTKIRNITSAPIYIRDGDGDAVFT